MFGLQWNERLTRKSRHPMADAAEAARLIRELPRDNPTSAVAEGAAWLESIESESFVPNHRLHLVSMIDEAVNARVDELALAYIGAAPGTPGLASDWRLLMDYLDRLSAAYGLIVEAAAERRHADLAPRAPLVIVRMMRAVTLGMKVSWLRYLPPDRASWETLVRCFLVARSRGLEATMVTAYAPDALPTCALHELAVAVMLAAGAPQSLTPRQVELAHRIALAHRGRFSVTARQDTRRGHCILDLDNAGPPARIPEQAEGGDRLFFSAERVLSELAPVVENGRGSALALMPELALGREFGLSEKLATLEHVLRFWGDNPPLRRGERTRINTRIQVEVGAQAICAALDTASDKAHLDFTRPAGGAEELPRVTTLSSWTLTDFSSRGIGARFSRRLDRWLGVGSLVAFRLERSENWCVAIVRRLRTDARNQTDVGCEILTKDARLVQLEGPLARGSTILLPENAQLEAPASLLFEPGTHAVGQTFGLRDGKTERRIRLGAVLEAMDGVNRVGFALV